MNTKSDIPAEETVVRILHRDWVVDNKLQLGAFSLRPNETYISVNRPSVQSFSSDVALFVESHPMFQLSEDTYQCGVLSVGMIRDIKVKNDGKPVNVDVEVEPRIAHVASHAGIFTRVGTTNIKKGITLPAEALPIGVSADDILMEVCWSLIDISTIEKKHFK